MALLSFFFFFHRTIVLSILPTLLLVGILLLSLRWRPAGGHRNPFSIGESKARIIKENIRVHFKDIAGCEEAKMEILELVNFLKDPHQYKDLGAKIPKVGQLTYLLYQHFVV